MGNFKVLLIALTLLGSRSFAASAVVADKLPETGKSGLSAEKPAPSAATPAFDMEKLRSELEKPSEFSNEANSKSKYGSMGYRESLTLTLKVVFYLALLLGLIYFGLRFIKKGSQGSGAFGRRNGSNIELIESALVGQHKSVNLIKVLNRVMVVGITDKGMSLLTEFDEQGEVDEILSRQKSSNAGLHKGFSTAINGFLEKFAKKDHVKLTKVGEALKAEAAL